MFKKIDAKIYLTQWDVYEIFSLSFILTGKQIRSCYCGCARMGFLFLEYDLNYDVIILRNHDVINYSQFIQFSEEKLHRDVLHNALSLFVFLK